VLVIMLLKPRLYLFRVIHVHSDLSLIPSP
jgi:hypothetical protein